MTTPKAKAVRKEPDFGIDEVMRRLNSARGTASYNDLPAHFVRMTTKWTYNDPKHSYNKGKPDVTHTTAVELLRDAPGGVTPMGELKLDAFNNVIAWEPPYNAPWSEVRKIFRLLEMEPEV